MKPSNWLSSDDYAKAHSQMGSGIRVEAFRPLAIPGSMPIRYWYGLATAIEEVQEEVIRR